MVVMFVWMVVIFILVMFIVVIVLEKWLSVEFLIDFVDVCICCVVLVVVIGKLSLFVLIKISLKCIMLFLF